MLGNHNSNRNKSHTQLFSEITKQSPTKIIIQTGNETHTNTVIDNTDHNTQTMKKISTMYTLAMTSAKTPKNI